MANRSLFTTLIRRYVPPFTSLSLSHTHLSQFSQLTLWKFETNQKRSVKHKLGATSPWRPMSSKSSPLNVTARSGIGNKDLMSEILRLKSPKRSAITLLQNRAEQGHKFSVSELRRITRQLIKSKRHDHALEVSSSTLVTHKYNPFSF